MKKKGSTISILEKAFSEYNLQTRILSFLWIRDMFSIGSISKAFWNANSFHSPDGSAIMLMIKQLYTAIFQFQNHIAYFNSNPLRLNQLQAFGISKAFLFFKRMFNCLNYKMHSVLFSADFLILHVAESYLPCIERAVEFNKLEEYDERERGIGAKMQSCTTERCYKCTLQYSRSPFSKIITLSDTRVVISLSCIAYFEVLFHWADSYSNNASASSNDYNGEEKGKYILSNKVSEREGSHLSIGLGAPSFNYKTSAPGTDEYSFGFHGSGDIFLSGEKLYHSSTELGYSSNDVVGCGIIYPPLSRSPNGSIFFTKNGKLLNVSELSSKEFVLSNPLFPLVVRF